STTPATPSRRTGRERSRKRRPTSWTITSSTWSAAAARCCSREAGLGARGDCGRFRRPRGCHDRPATKAALFSIVPYQGEAERGTWPVPARTYSADVARRSMEMALEQYELADELGFDWVTLAEHHFAPLSLTPNPMVLAGAVTQRVRRAKIALLGATI